MIHGAHLLGHIDGVRVSEASSLEEIMNRIAERCGSAMAPPELFTNLNRTERLGSWFLPRATSVLT
jgi:hypothetical protein